MLIDQISLSSLRVFEAVYRLGNMSKAAEELFMTQPGVSQHVKSLEETLNAPLFDRIGRKLIPTDKANTLYEDTAKLLTNLEDSLTIFQGKQTELKGTINLGLPIEFGNNIIIPFLSSWAKDHKHVTFKINYGHAAQMDELLLQGKLDFAIVDSYAFQKQIKTKNMAKETLVLCCSKRYFIENNMKETMPFKAYSKLEYVDYVEGAPILKQWFSHHFRGKIPALNIRANLMDVQGLAHMISGSLGLGVLPMHMVKKMKSLNKELVIIEGPKGDLFNELNIATLDGKTLSRACEKFIEDLTGMF